jgi:DNA-binding PadR family transcriptional regulator
MDTNREILRGFIKVHILYHAHHEPVYGLGLIEELARHEYHLSPGTLYPILHAMEQEGYLQSHGEVVGGKVRRYYRTTPTGDAALEEAQAKIRELVAEVLEEVPSSEVRENEVSSPTSAGILNPQPGETPDG